MRPTTRLPGAGVLACRSVLVCSLLSLGCADGDEAPGTAIVSVEDSSGVEVLLFDRDRLSVGWELSVEPEWVIGSRAGARTGLDLYGIVGAAIVDDSLVALAERSTNQVILVRPDGSLVGRFGGRGEGPSEFQQLSHVFGGSGGVGAWDGDRGRYVEFDLAGRLRFERQVPRTGAQTMFTVVSGGAAGLNRDALWVWTWPRERVPPGEIVRVRGALVSLTDPQDTLTVRYGLARKGISPGHAGSLVFGPDARFADGEGGVWVGDTAVERVEFVDNAGELKRVVEVDGVALLEHYRQRGTGRRISANGRTCSASRSLPPRGPRPITGTIGSPRRTRNPTASRPTMRACFSACWPPTFLMPQPTCSAGTRVRPAAASGSVSMCFAQPDACFSAAEGLPWSLALRWRPSGAPSGRRWSGRTRLAARPHSRPCVTIGRRLDRSNGLKMDTPVGG
jgi:hypothetical protein